MIKQAFSHSTNEKKLREAAAHVESKFYLRASFPGSPCYKEGGEPGPFYHMCEVKGRREVDTT